VNTKQRLSCIRLSHYIAPLSYIGLAFAVLFFAISLSPSLLPRPYLLQGVLSGLSLALGYAFGVVLNLLWCYFQLPKLKESWRSIMQYIALFLSLLLLAFSLYYSNEWQNNLRTLMNLPPRESGLHTQMAAIAFSIAASLLFISRFLKIAFYKTKTKLKRLIPQRIANALSLLLVASLVFLFANNIAIRNLVDMLDEAYMLADASSDKGIMQPLEDHATGSQASIIVWDTLGRTGQNFVVNGPHKEELEHYFGGNVSQPLRVYVGLRSKETATERAELALKELIRVNGFKRSKLVIATPTGTGWLDPSAMDTFEYLHRGDTAIVTTQYSYLPSWLTLLVDPSSARESASALYNTIHQYWSALPEESRPELYLFGLSLGSLGAETSINLMTLINNPIQGGLFAGPPFPNTLSPQLTRHRNKNSPQWLPVIQDSSLVRFTSQENKLQNEDWSWGPMRFVYIQYASDPMVFFSLDLYRKEPDWMKGERGYDVSPEFKWYPIITFLQVLFDLPMADRMPKGSSHNYSASSYIDGWVEVTQPKDWEEKEIKRLKKQFIGR